MTYLDTIILSIIEGVTEFLPISSTGHLILASSLLKLPKTEFLKSFEIIIQLGAILAVVVLYWRTITRHFRLVTKVAIAFLPTMVVGFTLYKIVKKIFLGNEYIVVWSLLLGGILLILFEYLHKEKETATGEMSAITNKQALLIGLAQSVAVVPGISRAAATIVGGLILGLKRKTIVEFSFLLAIPTMAAATALDLIKSAPSFQSSDFGFLTLGLVVSFAVALLTIKFLLTFIRSHTFIGFGIYRILLAIAFLLFYHRP